MPRSAGSRPTVAGRPLCADLQDLEFSAQGVGLEVRFVASRLGQIGQQVTGQSRSCKPSEVYHFCMDALFCNHLGREP